MEQRGREFSVESLVRSELARGGGWRKSGRRSGLAAPDVLSGSGFAQAISTASSSTGVSTVSVQRVSSDEMPESWLAKNHMLPTPMITATWNSVERANEYDQLSRSSCHRSRHQGRASGAPIISSRRVFTLLLRRVLVLDRRSRRPAFNLRLTPRQLAVQVNPDTAEMRVVLVVIPVDVTNHGPAALVPASSHAYNRHDPQPAHQGTDQ